MLNWRRSLLGVCSGRRTKGSITKRMNTRKYEALYLVAPTHSADEIKIIADKFKGIVEKNGGTVEKAELWEKRKLAYEIAKLREANYIIMIFDAPAQLPAELDRLMRIDEQVIRHTIGLLSPEAIKAAAKTPVEA